MEVRVKERLTGAIVLAALVVIVVPEILSGPKRAASSASGSHTVTIDLSGTHHLAPATVPAGDGLIGVRPDGAGGPAAPEAVANVPAAETHATEPAPPAAGTDSSPSGAKPGAPSAARRQAPQPPRRLVPRPQSRRRLQPPAAQASRPTPSQPTEAVAGWVVQLGSFISRDNAQKLVHDLQHKGYKVFVSEFRGSDKVLYRVRVGPEQDRARADALRLRLANEGYKGSVTPHP